MAWAEPDASECLSTALGGFATIVQLVRRAAQP